MVLSMAPIQAPEARADATTDQLTAYRAYQTCLAQTGQNDQTCRTVTGYKEPPPSTEITCNSLDSCVILLVYYVGPGMAGWVAYIGAYFFSIVVQLSLNSTAYALDFLSTGWETVRDIANMAFIFILIYIALTVMLAAETSGTIKTLAVVIVIALLVNFSFFFTRVVIDAGNIVAVQFYNAIPLDEKSQTGGFISGTKTKDLSLSIMNAVKPQELLNVAMLKKVQETTGSNWGTVGVYLVLFLSVAAMLWMLFFAFLQVGIKFMMRIVGLWFVLIASPLAFVAKTMKQTSHFFDDWLQYLIKFSFYPAIFLFMFWILTKFTTSILSSGDKNGISGNGSLMNSLFQTTPTGGSVELGTVAVIATVAIRMGFVMAVLYVGLKVSDWIVKEGSGLAGNITGRIGSGMLGTAKFAGKYGPGWAAGAAYRRTGGALAAGASNALQRSNWANRAGTLGGMIGYRLRRNITEPLANTSLGTVASTYRGREEFLGTRRTEMTRNLRDRENHDIAERVVARGGAAPANAQEHTDENRVRRLNGREVETLSANQLAGLAHLLTQAHVQGVERSNNYSDQEKERIINAWNVRGTRANNFNGQFGSDDAAINRTDRLLEEVNRLQTIMGRVANNITAGTRVTGTLIRDAIADVQRHALDPATARHTVLQAQLSQSAAAEVSARMAGNLAQVAQHQRDIAQRQQDIAAVLTEVRNATTLIQSYTNLDTARGNLVSEPSHHVNHAQPAPGRGEFDAR